MKGKPKFNYADIVKFKIGDKVYVIHPSAPHYGLIGEVVDIDINVFYLP